MLSSVVFPVHRIAVICVMIAIALTIFPNRSRAQSGKEFLVCFMQNESPTYDGTPTRYQDISFASVSDPTTVTITCRAVPKWKKVISIPAQGSTVYRLSTDSMISSTMGDAILETDELIDSVVFRVVSTAPIVCLGMSNKTFTADAFFALPRESALNEYIVMSYANSEVAQAMPSEFCVASFDDNDTVTIIPSAVTALGNPVDTPLKYVLNAGECIQIQTDPNIPLLDLTGSIVRSTKPVVVYGGSARTEVPTGFSMNGGTSRDHLAEAIPPVAAWGKFFAAKNTGRPLGDLIRVVASVNNTVIKINGQIWGAPLTAGGFRDTMIIFSDIVADDTYGVEASNPILIGLIGHSGDQNTKIGDPFLAMIMPLERTGNFSIFFITQDGSYDPNQEFVTIVTEQSGKDKITIDDVKVPSWVFTDISTPLNGKLYSSGTLTQTPGVHRIASENTTDNGFTAMAYGFGPDIGYGYCVGSAPKPVINFTRLPVSSQVRLENFPNPAFGRTTITFSIPAFAYASLKIYDALGRMVKVVIQGMITPDEHSIGISTIGLAAGSYSIELLAPDLGINEHRQMIVIQ